MRGEGDLAGVGAVIRAEVAGLDPEIPVYDLQTVEQVVFGSIVQDRSSTFLLTIFAAIALFLAAIGVYGVMAHSVSRRTHEIGIRMTLGACRREILALVIRQGMRLAVIAAGLGVVLSLAVTRVLEGALFEVTSLDPITFASPNGSLCEAKMTWPVSQP